MAALCSRLPQPRARSGWLEQLQQKLTDLRNQAIAADACSGAVLDVWVYMLEALGDGTIPTADDRYGATFATAHAAAQLRAWAGQLEQLGAMFDAALAVAAGERVQ